MKPACWGRPRGEVSAPSESFVLLLLLPAAGGARPDSQFQTVSSGVYWAIVTMTTVGYGDVVPQTELGRLLASVVMLLGFGIIAIPTGILTVSGVRHHQQRSAELVCSSCGRQGHRRDARHCDACGASLPSRA